MNNNENKNHREPSSKSNQKRINENNGRCVYTPEKRGGRINVPQPPEVPKK